MDTDVDRSVLPQKVGGRSLYHVRKSTNRHLGGFRYTFWNVSAVTLLTMNSVQPHSLWKPRLRHCHAAPLYWDLG